MSMPADDDPPLRTVRLRIGLLAACYLASLVACIPLVMTNAQNTWVAAPLTTVLTSLPGMLVIGIVFPAPYRLFNGVLSAVAALLIGRSAYGMVGHDLPDFPIALLLAAMVVAALVPCLALRLAGLTLCKLGRAQRVQPMPLLRFTIAQLMLLTALVAAGLTLVRWLPRFNEADRAMEIQIIIIYGSYAASSVTITLLALWAVMQLGRIWIRVLIAVVGMVVASGAAPWYLEFDFNWPWLAFNLGYGIVTIFALLVVRSCGYRLVYQSNLQRLIEYLELR